MLAVGSACLFLVGGGRDAHQGLLPQQLSAVGDVLGCNHAPALVGDLWVAQYNGVHGRTDGVHGSHVTKDVASCYRVVCVFGSLVTCHERHPTCSTRIRPGTRARITAGGGIVLATA